MEGAHRVKDIIAELSEFSSIRNPGLTREDINELIEKAIKVAWNELKYKAEVEKQFSELPLVLCNGGKLVQVFLNLLVNAVQSVESRGVITLRSRHEGHSFGSSSKIQVLACQSILLARFLIRFLRLKKWVRGQG